MRKGIFFILAIILFSLSNVVFGAIPAEEREALVKLYLGTHGDDWNSNSGWKTPPLDSDGFAMPGTEENWFGITVSGDHVTQISMSFNKLIGILPPELGNLTNLTILSLGHNHLSRIPSTLGNLTNLEYLFLEECGIKGIIPPRLGNILNLKHLNLSGNQLNGNIPSTFGNLSNLIDIDLSRNQLSGSIPSTLGNLDNLERFFVGANQLSGSIPSSLGDLRHLKRISLSQNQLTGSIPPEMGKLRQLMFLSMDHNQLAGGIPPELGKLTNLLQLELSDNKLTGIPPELGNIYVLQMLDLSYNQINGHIPDALGYLNTLTYLNLSHNQLSGGIPSNFRNLSTMRYLYLHSNQLSGHIPDEIGSLNQLLELRLDLNQFSGHIPWELGTIPKLRVLLLNSNWLSGEIPASLMKLHFYDFDISDNCLFTTDPALKKFLDTFDPDWKATQNHCGGGTPIIHLNHSRLNFASLSGLLPNSQTVLISNAGVGTLSWSASSDAPWLTVSPSSGTGSSLLSVSIRFAPEGESSGTITITDPYATNSPQTIHVSLHVYRPGETSAPFGEFSTPIEGSSVSNSIPVTGWALDDTGFLIVKIYNGNTYIGDAEFVEGARPDIESLYPTYPNNDKAGWGYLLLTNLLPNGGNGTYTLIAKAMDIENNEVTLGSKTITIDNAHAVKPFGAIDTPTQGGTASGKEFVNFGWALTPQPHTIPSDGSTIDVVIDGVIKGHPVYNTFRSDIADLFPGYNNSNGAGGYFYIDTATLKNGLHTLSWNVTDNEGNTDGIGSRYFSVLNTGVNTISWSLTETHEEPFEGLISADGDGKWIEIKELERVEIDLSKEMGLSDTHIQGYLLVGHQLRKLPIGSTLDQEKGIFYWQPGPGFVGEYRFVFIGKDDRDQTITKNIIIHIQPAYQHE
ncbi:MAG: BACON domain-containing protein [Candidatus Omnitrophota bacterium]